jgi:hypothetical protein
VPTLIHLLTGDRPLSVDEEPEQVQIRLGSGRRVVELHRGGAPVYVNPSAIAFFAPDSDSVDSGPRYGEGFDFGRP